MVFLSFMKEFYDRSKTLWVNMTNEKIWQMKDCPCKVYVCGQMLTANEIPSL